MEKKSLQIPPSVTQARKIQPPAAARLGRAGLLLPLQRPTGPTPSLHLIAGTGTTSGAVAQLILCTEELAHKRCLVGPAWSPSSQPQSTGSICYPQYSAKDPYNQPQDKDQSFEGGCGMRRRDQWSISSSTNIT